MTNNPNSITTELLDEWATDPKGPVALHMRQKLLPVGTISENGGEVGIVYPPTYADIGYNIDVYTDGKKVALIDSPASQANRLEPMFKANSERQEDWLVPQIDIVLRTEDCGDCDNCKKANRKRSDECLKPRKEKVSLLDLAHRSADAVVQSSPTLFAITKPAFDTLRKTGDAEPLCTIAPTSLVFGVWDSRGGSGEKRPRLVRSIIRAWDVEILHAAAQYNSVWKLLNDKQKDALEKEAKAKKKKLSEKGLKDAPAVFRDPNVRVLGGVLVRDRIERDVAINLVALRGLRGKTPDKSSKIRKYLLGLSLLAATEEIDLFLREGCHLKYADKTDQWFAVPRRGEPTTPNLSSENGRKTIHEYTRSAAAEFRSEWPQREHVFDLQAAKNLLAKTTEDEEGGD